MRFDAGHFPCQDVIERMDTTTWNGLVTYISMLELHASTGYSNNIS